MTLVLTLLPTVAGCSRSTSSPQTDSTPDVTQTQAYIDGYRLNIGASAAQINNAGSASAFCSANAALHPDYSSTEQQNYVLGCIAAVPEAGYTDPSSTTDTTGSAGLSGDLLSRLQDSGNADWSEDAFGLSSDLAVGFNTDYLSDGCTLWVFDSQDSAQTTFNYGFFNTFSDYQLSIGTDLDGNGVMAMFLDPTSPCATDMLYALNWSNY